MRFIILFALLYIMPGKMYCQTLSYHNTTLFGKKYYKSELKISKKEFIQLLQTEISSSKLYKMSKKNKNLSSYCNVGQWILVLLQVNEAFDNDTDYGYRYLAGNVLLGIGTIYFKDKSENLFRQSVNAYNKQKSFLSYDIMSNGKIVGLTYNF